MALKRSIWGLLALLVGAVALACAMARPSVPQVAKMPVSDPLLIVGVTVVDPRDGTLAPNMIVETRAGRIVNVAPGGGREFDRGIRRIDATGKFLVPGFNDMHSHVLEANDPSRELAFMLSEGVTGFRQMSGSDKLLRERREGTLPVGPVAPALLQMPGKILTPFNAGSVDAVRKEVGAQIANGADFIKVALTSPEVFYAALAAAKQGGRPILGHLQNGVDPARASREGFRSIEHLGPGAAIWVHCSSQSAALLADAAANPQMRTPPPIPFLETIVMARMQERLINPAAFADPSEAVRLQKALDSYDPARCTALARTFVANSTWNVPTLVRLRTQELADDPAYLRDPALAYMAPADIDRWRKVTDRYSALPAATLATYHQAYAEQMKLAKLFSDLGVPMMLGTDSGEFKNPGQTMPQEFAELAKAGISPLRILQMATLNPAIYLGRTDKMGRIAPGYNADLVLLDANPIEDIAALGRIWGVVRAGLYYSRTDLDGIRARTRVNTR